MNFELFRPGVLPAGYLVETGGSVASQRRPGVNFFFNYSAKKINIFVLFIFINADF
jgi:hypothetical protein